MKVPKGFSKDKPEATSKARLKAKTQRDCSPEGFWLLVWPRMWPRVCLKKIPKGVFNILPREYIDYSRDLLRAPFTMIPPRLSYSSSFFLPNTPVHYCET